MKLPTITKQKILYIDATSDNSYPLRILQAYRENCNMKWEVHGLSKNKKTIYDMMNKHQDERAEILDKAIAVLTEAL